MLCDDNDDEKTRADAGIRLACRACSIAYADQIWPSCRLPAIDKVAVPRLCGSAALPAICMGLRIGSGGREELEHRWNTYYWLPQILPGTQAPLQDLTASCRDAGRGLYA